MIFLLIIAGMGEWEGCHFSKPTVNLILFFFFSHNYSATCKVSFSIYPNISHLFLVTWVISRTVSSDYVEYFYLPKPMGFDQGLLEQCLWIQLALSYFSNRLYQSG